MSTGPGGGLFSVKRRVFISFHHGGDQWACDQLSTSLTEHYDIASDSSLDRTVDSTDPEYVMRRIREKHLTGSSCTIVLCGARTPWRKYVDWEIKATLDKQHGLIAVQLPTAPVDEGTWIVPLGGRTVNWYGITDVGDLLDGPNIRSYAVEWMGSLANRFEIAERVSPMTYVRLGLPPTLTIHGDADPTVPYQQAVSLHEKLDDVGVPNALHTVPGGGHGGFNREETLAIFETIQQFLSEHGLGAGMATTQGQ